MVSAWTEPQFIVSASDGVTALACTIDTTEMRPSRAGEEQGGIQADIFDLPGKFVQYAMSSVDGSRVARGKLTQWRWSG